MIGLMPRMLRVGWRRVHFDEVMVMSEEEERYIDETFIFTIARFLSDRHSQPRLFHADTSHIQQ